MADAPGQHCPQMTFARDQHPIGAFTTHGAHPALGARAPWGAVVGEGEGLVVVDGDDQPVVGEKIMIDGGVNNSNTLSDASLTPG